MVRISSQRDFNTDMQSYLDRRVKGSSSSSFFKRVDNLIPKRSSSDRVPRVDTGDATVYEDGPKRSFFWFLSFRSAQKKDLSEEDVEEIEEVEEELEEVNHEVEELEDVREGLLSRFFRLLRGGNRQDDNIEGEDVPEDIVAQQLSDSREALENETRMVLKLVHKWLGKLPPEQITAFRRSPDFNRYKDLLDKYGLIK